MTNLPTAFLLTVIMGIVIFFCRVFPFIFFNQQNDKSDINGKKSANTSFLHFVEKTAPPVAMTILAFNAMASPINKDISLFMPVLIASCITAAFHLWKHNTLLSIFAGTALYMIILKFNLFHAILIFLNLV
ncbi:branched-chain amino acid transporter AzlD [Spirochaetia bacterium]|nr:branched-chain amino acid transporter AzlD [Spirochaetia bacterium]